MRNITVRQMYAPHTMENKDIANREKTRPSIGSDKNGRVVKKISKTPIHIPLTATSAVKRPNKGRFKRATIKSTADSVKEKLDSFENKVRKDVSSVKKMTGVKIAREIEKSEEEFIGRLNQAYVKLVGVIDQQGKISYGNYEEFVEAQTLALGLFERDLWSCVSQKKTSSSKIERQINRRIQDLEYQLNKELSALEAA